MTWIPDSPQQAAAGNRRAALRRPFLTYSSAPGPIPTGAGRNPSASEHGSTWSSRSVGLFACSANGRPASEGGADAIPATAAAWNVTSPSGVWSGRSGRTSDQATALGAGARRGSRCALPRFGRRAGRRFRTAPSGGRFRPACRFLTWLFVSFFEQGFNSQRCEGRAIGVENSCSAADRLSPLHWPREVQQNEKASV